MRRISLVIALALVAMACGSSSTAPSAVVPTPTPTPVPVSVSLTGVVTAQSGAALIGATVLIGDGANAGRTATTGGNGFYSFTGLTPGNGNIGASASGFLQAVKGINVGSVSSLNFVLQTAAPFTMTGVGNTVFDMPTFITRVHIVATFGGNCQNFIVSIGGRTVANEILGTCSVVTTGTR
jgi:Carboxypeptidase regulatory-like domain